MTTEELIQVEFNRLKVAELYLPVSSRRTDEELLELAKQNVNK